MRLCRPPSKLPKRSWAIRVLLRPSGTEPVVRVMVEAASAEEADRHAQAIAAVVEREA